MCHENFIFKIISVNDWSFKNNYEAFIIQNYKFNHLGLFHDEDSIYAVIQNYKESNTTLDEIQELYNYRFKTAGVPGPTFTEEVKDNYIK